MPPPKTSPASPSEPVPVKQSAGKGRPLPRLEACPVITHDEAFGRIEQGGCLRGVVLEAQKDEPRPQYAVYLLSSWRKEYTVLGLGAAQRAKLFRDLDRVLGLVRFEYAFKGTVAIRLADDGPARKQSWRISHGSDFSRSAGIKKQGQTRGT